MKLHDAQETPEDFAEEEREPDEMNFSELLQYISRVKQSGGRVRKHLVELHFKISFPLVNFIVLLVGTPLSTRIRKGTLTMGAALSLLIAFTYYGFLRTGQALGHSGSLPAPLAAWLGNIFFGVIGVILLRKLNR
jgi:lipopolysaccharide export system permease protein